MVEHSEAQFYTMEGIAAAVLMVLTAYLVMSTTTIYTPGDSHIIDMQLEQVGNDALKIMDTKNSYSETQTDLEYYITNMTNTTSKTNFRSEFLTLLNTTSLISNIDYLSDNIFFEAQIYYRLPNDTVRLYNFVETDRKFSGNENAVRVSHWVFIKKPGPNPPPSLDFDNRNQTVLLEVLLWRN
jgi:hypothetical protein